MKQVKFTRTIPPYVLGDVAEFEDKQAELFIANNAAVLYHPLRESSAGESKSLDAPPKDKMVKKGEVKTK
jgi:hypothetical protein